MVLLLLCSVIQSPLLVERVIVVPGAGWKNSAGAQTVHAEAKRRGNRLAHRAVETPCPKWLMGRRR